jgi:hypothetical protein
MDKRPAGHQNREGHEIWPVPRWPVVCSATPGETLMRGSLSFPSSPLKNLAILWAFVTGRRLAAVCWGLYYTVRWTRGRHGIDGDV